MLQIKLLLRLLLLLIRVQRHLRTHRQRTLSDKSEPEPSCATCFVHSLAISAKFSTATATAKHCCNRRCWDSSAANEPEHARATARKIQSICLSQRILSCSELLVSIVLVCSFRVALLRLSRSAAARFHSLRSRSRYRYASRFVDSFATLSVQIAISRHLTGV